MRNNRESYSSPANDQVTGSGMFLRLNQDYIPEFRKYKVQSMQLKTAGEIIEIDLPWGEMVKSFLIKMIS